MTPTGGFPFLQRTSPVSRRTNDRRRTARRTVAVVPFLAILTLASTVPAKSSVGCRVGIAHSMRRMTHTGLGTIDKCHAKQNAGGDVGPCNELPEQGATPWGRQVNRTGSFVSFKCLPDDTAVRENYPPCQTTDCDNITSTIVPGTQVLIEAGAAAVTAETPLSGRAARCQRAITKAQRAIAFHVLERSQACQARLDRKSDGTFGPLSEECVADAGSVATRGEAKIERACGALTGADVGSCEPLPDCVASEAQTLGQELARLTYGEPSTCGDGVQDPLEECDDGNTVTTDACTDECNTAICGDGITWEGVEECDDGNDIATDDCDACHLPVCGDGIEAGSEECDDGNDVAGDGCTACVIDAVLCGAGGLRATVVYEDPTNSQAAAGRMLLAYPPAVSLPGSGAATGVRQRVGNASGTANPIFLPSDTDTNSDGADDTLVLVFGITDPWPPGPMATITFDCTAGTPVRAPDFDCSFNDASDAFSNAIDPTKLVCSVTALEPIP